MRKALITAAVAAALFAVGAFAASFAVDSEDIASGNDQVAACAPNVKVDFDTPLYSASTHAWTVKGATVTFLNGAATPVSTCAGGDLTLKVSTTTNGEAATGTVTNMPTGSTSAHVTFDETAVKEINGSAVLVDDIFLTPTAIP